MRLALPLMVMKPNLHEEHLLKNAFCPDSTPVQSIMKKFSALAMLILLPLVADAGSPNLLSVNDLAVLPRYSLVTVGSVAELKALSLTVLSTSTMGIVLGYYSPGDRGGGNFLWDPASTLPDDGGSCLNPTGNTGPGRWLRALGAEPANVRMWGARGNWLNNPSPADDTKAIQAAFDACSSSGIIKSGELRFPGGFYLISDTILFCSIIHVRGEGMINNTTIIMSNSVQKDMFCTLNASNLLSGFDTGAYDDAMLIENMVFLRKGPGINSSNACLVIGRPGEGHAIHNVLTDGGGYGIRCIGAGSPGLRLRDCSLSDAAIAGLSFETKATSSGGPVSIIGMSGDCRGVASSNSSLVLISACVPQVSIDTIKIEGTWGGGAIQYRWPDPASGSTASGSMGFLHVANLNYSVDPATPFNLHDVIVLKGGERTPSVSLHNFNLLNSRDLIRDEVAQRHIASDANIFGNLAQQTLRLPICYESFTNTATTNISLLTRSRLVVGGSQIYSFTPPSPGWYRVMTSVNSGQSHLGGNLSIFSPGIQSTELQADVSPYASGTNRYFINVVRSTADSDAVPPPVDRARVFSYYDGQLNGQQCFMDVHVAVTGAPITLAHDIHVKGDTDSGELPLLAPVSPVADALPSGAGSLDVSVLR